MTYSMLYRKALDALDPDTWATDSVKCMLLDASYTPSQSGDEFIDDVSANEVSGTGYVAGGVALSNKTVDMTTDLDRYSFKCDPIVFATVTIDFQYAVFYIDSGTPSTSPVIQMVDYETVVSAVGVNVTINPPAGVFAYSQAN